MKAWKEREELAKERAKAFWRPEIVYIMPNGDRIELDHDNVAYYVNTKGERKRVHDLQNRHL